MRRAAAGVVGGVFFGAVGYLLGWPIGRWGARLATRPGMDAGDLMNIGAVWGYGSAIVATLLGIILGVVLGIWLAGKLRNEQL
jgi:hypothetical protein